MVLEVKNVNYAYKSQKGKEILKKVSMQFEEKKFYTIVGAAKHFFSNPHKEYLLSPINPAVFLFRQAAHFPLLSDNQSNYNFEKPTKHDAFCGS